MSLLTTKLRGVAALLRNGQSIDAPTLDKLLLEAADRIELLEAPERVIELARATAYSVGDIMRIIEQLSAMDIKPLNQLQISKES